MAMPRKLKLMNVFLNGYSYQGAYYREGDR